MPKEKRSRAAGSTRPDDLFGARLSCKRVMLSTLLPRFLKKPAGNLDALRSKLPCFTLCDSKPYVCGYFVVSDAEYSRYSIDWLACCLCFTCFAAPESSKPRLLICFDFGLNVTEGGVQ
jgi:hypothetical protein